MARGGVLGLDQVLHVVVDPAGEAGAGETGFAAAPSLKVEAEILAE